MQNACERVGWAGMVTRPLIDTPGVIARFQRCPCLLQLLICLTGIYRRHCLYMLSVVGKHKSVSWSNPQVVAAVMPVAALPPMHNTHVQPQHPPPTPPRPPPNPSCPHRRGILMIPPAMVSLAAAPALAAQDLCARATTAGTQCDSTQPSHTARALCPQTCCATLEAAMPFLGRASPSTTHAGCLASGT